jgi:type II secretory pathway pseudopilin PulG
MIEIVFVIVILGILATIALARFASIADDAAIAAEKNSIGAIRSSIETIKVRALAHYEVNISALDAAGKFHHAAFGRLSNNLATASGEQNVSTSGYPNSLSFAAWGAGGVSQKEATRVTPSRASAAFDNDARGPTACAVALEPSSRENFETFESAAAAGLNNANAALEATPADLRGGITSVIVSKASRSISDKSLDICNGKGWLYNSRAGNIVLVGECF